MKLDHSPVRPPLALVTGASSGIGQAVAHRLAARGYRLVLVARRRDRLESLVNDLRPGADAIPLVLDLSRPEQIESMVGPALQAHGPVDILLNNAGYGRCVGFLDENDDEHRQLMQVNYFAAVALIRAVLPGMLARHHGHVINVASIATKVGPWGHGGYAAAKSAVVALTQSLACEYQACGLHFTYVNPGIVRTEFFNDPSYRQIRRTVQQRAIDPDLVARRIVAVIERPRIELCVPSHFRILDWIKALNPTWAQRLVARTSRPS